MALITVAVTWSTTDKTNITLSNGNLTATPTSAPASWNALVRASQGYTFGKYYLEAVVSGNSGSGTGNWAIGVANASQSNYLGSSANGVGYYALNGQFSDFATTIASAPNGSTIGVAYDFDNKKLWVRVNGANWNNDVIGNQNPTNNTGGFSFSVTGKLFPIFEANTALASIVTNFGASSWASPPPNGFFGFSYTANRDYYIATSSITLPSYYNANFALWEVIGAGGSASMGQNGVHNAEPGGGGAYSATMAIQSLTPGQTINVNVSGTSTAPSSINTVGTNGGDTWVAANNTATVITSSGVFVGAKGGHGGGISGTNAGVGGAAASGVGTTKYSGGNGANTRGGGGGAAGPSGAGANGAGDNNNTNNGGGGGGGASGGSAGTASSSTTGGVGGNGPLGSGGGSGGTNGNNGSAGTNGGGGGGGGGGTTVHGGDGGAGTDWDSTHGAGGGGGEASSSFSPASGMQGGSGGLYGGGGGSFAGGVSGIVPGNGAAGLIVATTYTPSVQIVPAKSVQPILNYLRTWTDPLDDVSGLSPLMFRHTPTLIFTSGRVTQTSALAWLANTPLADVTQTGTEAWVYANSKANVTQVGAAAWIVTPNSSAGTVTQVTTTVWNAGAIPSARAAQLTSLAWIYDTSGTNNAYATQLGQLAWLTSTSGGNAQGTQVGALAWELGTSGTNRGRATQLTSVVWITTSSVQVIGQMPHLMREVYREFVVADEAHTPWFYFRRRGTPVLSSVYSRRPRMLDYILSLPEEDDYSAINRSRRFTPIVNNSSIATTVASLVRETLVSGKSVNVNAVAREALISGGPMQIDSFVRETLVAALPGSGPIPIFPVLPQGWPYKVSPLLDTTVGTTKSLREVRVALRHFPLWDMEILFEELKDQTQNQTPYVPFAGQTQYQQLVQLWLMMYGQTNVFGFDCPWDNSRTNQGIGYGDGTTYAFTIYRTWGTGNEATWAPIGLINQVFEVRVDGIVIPRSEYYVDRNVIYFVGSDGITRAPGNGLPITMTFSFYYLCRFVADEQEFEEFAKARWTMPSLKFRAVYWP